MKDSEDYLARKNFFEGMITLFGRKPVLEALVSSDIQPFRLHLADSNRSAQILDEMLALAASRDIEIKYHSRQALSRISRNSKQDQGVAIDIAAPRYLPLESLLDNLPDEHRPNENLELIALDRITNPQNLGMIIRSIAASPCKGLILPKKGSAKIDPLVIKASAGALFKANIYYCESLDTALKHMKQKHIQVIGLSGEAEVSLAAIPGTGRKVFVLGNESEGISREIESICDLQVKIPLCNDVESLNVAVAASLVAFRTAISLSW